eukprot:3108612-Prymnesium_polylepis.2
MYSSVSDVNRQTGASGAAWPASASAASSPATTSSAIGQPLLPSPAPQSEPKRTPSSRSICASRALAALVDTPPAAGAALVALPPRAAEWRRLRAALSPAAAATAATALTLRSSSASPVPADTAAGGGVISGASEAAPTTAPAGACSTGSGGAGVAGVAGAAVVCCAESALSRESTPSSAIAKSTRTPPRRLPRSAIARSAGVRVRWAPTRGAEEERARASARAHTARGSPEPAPTLSGSRTRTRNSKLTRLVRGHAWRHVAAHVSCDPSAEAPHTRAAAASPTPRHTHVRDHGRLAHRHPTYNCAVERGRIAFCSQIATKHHTAEASAHPARSERLTRTAPRAPCGPTPRRSHRRAPRAARA